MQPPKSLLRLRFTLSACPEPLGDVSSLVEAAVVGARSAPKSSGLISQTATDALPIRSRTTLTLAAGAPRYEHPGRSACTRPCVLLFLDHTLYTALFAMFVGLFFTLVLDGTAPHGSRAWRFSPAGRCRLRLPHRLTLACARTRSQAGALEHRQGTPPASDGSIYSRASGQ